MSDLFSILVGIVLINDLVLARFLGPCPFLRADAALRSGLAASLAIVVALVVIGALTWGLEAWLLQPLGHTELQLIATTLVTVITVPALEIAISTASPAMRLALSPWPRPVMVNCAILAAALVSSGKFAAPGAGIAWAAGTGMAFGLAMLLYAELRRRLVAADVPRPMRGTAIVLLTGGILSLALSGLSGILRG